MDTFSWSKGLLCECLRVCCLTVFVAASAECCTYSSLCGQPGWDMDTTATTTRRTCSVRARPSGGASTDEPRRRQAQRATQPRRIGPYGQKANHCVPSRLAEVAVHRPDIAFARKECSRAVGKATPTSLARLKPIGRYLLHPPHPVWEFPLQDQESTVTIDGLCDPDTA